MAVFKFVVSDGKQSYQVERDQNDCPLFGKKIDDVFPADFLGLSGYELKITGGSDKDGFPMRKDIEGVGRKKIILTKGKGFSGTLRAKKGPYVIKGIRKRKLLKGNTIDGNLVQINCKVVKTGTPPLSEILGKKEKEGLC
ncbi:MAG: 30S ribosomal protein S6e [Candidatus Aenigmarchaeota archaeon]|nr:30S ribosomal protein S6e [Candidatus Aenigmarchaeota archaeon]